MVPSRVCLKKMELGEELTVRPRHSSVEHEDLNHRADTYPCFLHLTVILEKKTHFDLQNLQLRPDLLQNIEIMTGNIKHTSSPLEY